MEQTIEQAVDHGSHDGQGFIKVFIAVIAALTLFTFVCILAARSLAPGSVISEDSIVSAAQAKRIAPVGQVNTSVDQLEALPVAVMADTASMTGPELIASSCAACHQAGVAGAPKMDDAAEWGKRREIGLDQLVASVIDGKGAMPARAGTTLSDDQLRLAVQHLAGFDTADSALSSDSSGSAEPTGAESGATTAVAAGSELTARVKGVAEGLCAACHLAGVAGAPKLGDKAAWAERAEKGMDEMVKTVATGKGAMPPRGGTDLNDQELAAAISYLMAK